MSTRITLAFVVLLGTTAGASADDVWSDPFPGVRYLHRTTDRPRSIHVLVIDLDAPGIAFTANRHEHRNVTTPDFARQHGAMAAINGGLCGMGGDVCRAIQRGRYETWPDTTHVEAYASVAFGLDRFQILPAEPPLVVEEWMSGVLSSKPLLVAEGVAADTFPPEWDICREGVQHPRTAVGLSEDGRTLYLVVMDGRTGPVGMTCPDLAIFMRDLGAHWALNLDGGGSSTMWLRDDGVVNTPSDGSPRTVANHLGVFALGREYAAELVGVEAPAELAAGEVGTVSITYRNTGTEAWRPEQVGLRTTLTRDHPSALATDTWRTPSRPGGLEAEIAPGETGTLSFEVRAVAPADESCAMVEHFGLLLEGYGPFADVSTWFGPADAEARIEIAVRACGDEPADAGPADGGPPPAPDAGPPDAGSPARPAPPATSMSGGCTTAAGGPLTPVGMLLLASLLFLLRSVRWGLRSAATR